MREKCPTTEFFLVRIFLYLDWIRRFTVFSPNTGKYVLENSPYLDTYHAVNCLVKYAHVSNYLRKIHRYIFIYIYIVRYKCVFIYVYKTLHSQNKVSFDNQLLILYIWTRNSFCKRSSYRLLKCRCFTPHFFTHFFTFLFYDQ